MSKVKPVPEGYHTLTPYLVLDNAAAAIEIYKKAFGAVELVRMPLPNGKVAHAELQLGDSKIMLADEAKEMGFKSAASLGGSPISLHLYVNDADQAFEQALREGATVIRALENMFYGDRSALVKDPFGYTWCISTHVEDVSESEIKKRATEKYS